MVLEALRMESAWCQWAGRLEAVGLRYTPGLDMSIWMAAVVAVMAANAAGRLKNLMLGGL